MRLPTTGDKTPPDTTPPRTRHRTRGRFPSLLRDTAFRYYWAAQSVSYLGEQVSGLALPLIAVTVVHADAARMGYLGAAVWLPHLLFGPYAGSWADRRRRRRHVMVAADLGRFALLVSLPVARAWGGPTFWNLFVVAFAVGVLSVLFDVCNAPVFKTLVPPADYVTGNSLSSGSRAMAKALGPSVGGFLVQLFSAPFALLANALTYLLSAVFLTRVHLTETPPSNERGGLRAAARFIAGSAAVRAALAATATVNFFCFVTTTLFVLYATTALRLGPGLLGGVLGAGAVGAVVGAACATPVTRRLGVGRTLLLGCLLTAAPLLLVPASRGSLPVVLAMVVGAQFGSALGVIWIDITVSTLLVSLVPDTMRSSVFGAYQSVNLGMRPLAALIAGAVAAPLGLRTTLWIAAAGALTSCLWILRSPLSGRDLPAAGQEA